MNKPPLAKNSRRFFRQPDSVFWFYLRQAVPEIEGNGATESWRRLGEKPLDQRV